MGQGTDHEPGDRGAAAAHGEHGHGHAHTGHEFVDGTAPAAGTATIREERQPAQEDPVEVAPGIIRLQLPISLPGLGHVNCYAMADERGVTLVDPGLPGPQTYKHLTRRLADAELPIERVHTVVVTHSHPDHFGQAGRMREELGARVVTHRNFRTFFDPDEEPDEIATDDIGSERPTNARVASADEASTGARGGRAPWERIQPWGTVTSADSQAVDGGFGQAMLRKMGLRKGPGHPSIRRRLMYRAMRKKGGRMGAVPRPTHRVEDAERLEVGGRAWVSLHTPGHTNDHLCLYDPDSGVLLSGDHVLPTITPHISGTGPIVDPLAEFFRSLDRVAELDGETLVLPAHGLAFEDLAGRATAIRRHHEDRLQILRDTSAELGWATVPEYSTRLFPPRSYGSMADSETYAHLEHLRLTGEADVRDDGPELLYRIG